MHFIEANTKLLIVLQNYFKKSHFMYRIESLGLEKAAEK